MILFTLKEHQSGPSEFIEMKINLKDDYEAQIAVLDCNDTVLIAESTSENNLVLELATRYWLSCGMYYPEYSKRHRIILVPEFYIKGESDGKNFIIRNKKCRHTNSAC